MIIASRKDLDDDVCALQKKRNWNWNPLQIVYSFRPFTPTRTLEINLLIKVHLIIGNATLKINKYATLFVVVAITGFWKKSAAVGLCLRTSSI